MNNVKFYMQKVDSEYNAIDGTLKDLEIDFNGLRYKSCVGLNDKGKVKNKYIETFADSDSVRVWCGDNVVREATSITFEFVFIGVNRQIVYDEFYDYIKSGIIKYWDTARKKVAIMTLISEIKITDDIFLGIPHILVKLQFQNLLGECYNIDE